MRCQASPPPTVAPTFANLMDELRDDKSEYSIGGISNELAQDGLPDVRRLGGVGDVHHRRRPMRVARVDFRHSALATRTASSASGARSAAASPSREQAAAGSRLACARGLA